MEPQAGVSEPAGHRRGAGRHCGNRRPRCPLQPPVTPLVGRAEAVDGDTLRPGDVRVRLTGLDAPEPDQTCIDAGGASWPCGRQARGFVAGLIEGQPVTCRPDGRDRYRSVLARCFVSGGDLGTWVWAPAGPSPTSTTGAHGPPRHLGRRVHVPRRLAPQLWTGTFQRLGVDQSVVPVVRSNSLTCAIELR